MAWAVGGKHRPCDSSDVLTRRLLLACCAATLAVPGYAFGLEPHWRLAVRRHRVESWRGPRLRAAIIADLHAGEPFMGPARVRRIVASAQALRPDLVLMLGDYGSTNRWVTRLTPPAEIAPILAGLRAPLGCYAIAGNHDWWDDAAATTRAAAPEWLRALAAAGVTTLQNRAERHPAGFWIAGLDSQGAFRRRGADDLAGTLAQLTDDAPAILLAHEPDIFPRVPERIALTLSGHTHGGQVRLLGWSPHVPSRFGNRYALGHVREGRRELIVSGGLGTSILPVRFGVPPELTLVELG